MSKFHIFRNLCFILILLVISSCSSNHLMGLKFMPIKYAFENPDGSVWYSWSVAKDKSDKENETSLRVTEFNKDDINRVYEQSDTVEIQELTVSNLKTDFRAYDYTLLGVWYGCGGAVNYEIKQYVELVDTLSQVMSHPKKMAFTFASLSYRYTLIENVLSKFHYQSYVIPTREYGDVCVLKEQEFLRELSPEFYNEKKSHVVRYAIFLLDGHGNMLKYIEYDFDPAVGTIVKDFKKIQEELLGLVSD